MSGSRIGRGTVIRGAVRGEGDLEVEGRVEGVVEVDGDLEIGTSGRVTATQGALTGSRIVVRGAVAGDLTARESVVLEEGARVIGDLRAPSIGIRPGGLVRGHVSTEGAAPEPARAQASARAATPARATATTRAASPARPPAPPTRQAPRAPSRPQVEKEHHEAPAPAPRRAAPAPVMPALKKGAKGAMKKKGGAR